LFVLFCLFVYNDLDNFFFLVKSCDPISWMLILSLAALKFTILQFCGVLGKTVLLLLSCFLYIFIANVVRNEILWFFVLF